MYRERNDRLQLSIDELPVRRRSGKRRYRNPGRSVRRSAVRRFLQLPGTDGRNRFRFLDRRSRTGGLAGRNRVVSYFRTVFGRKRAPSMLQFAAAAGFELIYFASDLRCNGNGISENYVGDLADFGGQNRRIESAILSWPIDLCVIVAAYAINGVRWSDRQAPGIRTSPDGLESELLRPSGYNGGEFERYGYREVVADRQLSETSTYLDGLPFDEFDNDR